MRLKKKILSLGIPSTEPLYPDPSTPFLDLVEKIRESVSPGQQDDSAVPSPNIDQKAEYIGEIEAKLAQVAELPEQIQLIYDEFNYNRKGVEFSPQIAVEHHGNYYKYDALIEHIYRLKENQCSFDSLGLDLKDKLIDLLISAAIYSSNQKRSDSSIKAKEFLDWAKNLVKTETNDDATKDLFIEKQTDIDLVRIRYITGIDDSSRTIYEGAKGSYLELRAKKADESTHRSNIHLIQCQLPLCTWYEARKTQDLAMYRRAIDELEIVRVETNQLIARGGSKAWTDSLHRRLSNIYCYQSKIYVDIFKLSQDNESTLCAADNAASESLKLLRALNGDMLFNQDLFAAELYRLKGFIEYHRKDKQKCMAFIQLNEVIVLEHFKHRSTEANRGVYEKLVQTSHCIELHLSAESPLLRIPHWRFLEKSLAPKSRLDYSLSSFSFQSHQILGEKKEVLAEWIRPLLQRVDHQNGTVSSMLKYLQKKALDGAFLELCEITSPELNREGLRSYFYWLLFLFVYDDIVDSEKKSIGQSAEKIRHLNAGLTRYFEAFQGASGVPKNWTESVASDFPSFDQSEKDLISPIFIILQELFGMKGIQWQQASFFRSVYDYIDANEYENAKCRIEQKGTCPDLNEFANQRLLFGGVYTCFHMWSVAKSLSGTPINLDELFQNQALSSLLKSMATMANQSIVYSNDIFSFNKEKKGNGVSLLMYLKQHLNVHYDDVFGIAIHLHNEIIGKMAQLNAEFEQLPESSEKEKARLFIQMLKAWVRGNHSWSFISKRYPGMEGDYRELLAKERTDSEKLFDLQV